MKNKIKALCALKPVVEIAGGKRMMEAPGDVDAKKTLVRIDIKKRPPPL